MTTTASPSTASAPVTTGEPLLQVRDLHVRFQTPHGIVPAVRGVNLDLHRGEVLGIVGESGSGKSVTSLASMGLLPDTAIITGSVKLDGQQLLGASDREMSAIRGNKVAMVFQDPLSAFTPVYRIGDQIAEALRTHTNLSKDKAAARAVELLDLVGIPNPKARAQSFPHEFSGGMRQRAMIAMAIANDPAVILADEPTTALDVTIQAQVLEVLKTAQRETGAALVLVSHDLGVIAGTADRIAVMYAGRIVETGTVDDVFERPRMPYTLGLIGAVPRVDEPAEDGSKAQAKPLVPIPGSPSPLQELKGGCAFANRCPMVLDVCRTDDPVLSGDDHRVACHRTDEIVAKNLGPTDVYPLPEIPPLAAAAVPRDERRSVLRVTELVKTFPQFKGTAFKRRVGSVYAVDGVELDIRQGETLGLVGESGSGKSTTLFEILNMAKPESGSIELLGQDTGSLGRSELNKLRSAMQIVFQDPMASLDPRMPIADVIAEPMRALKMPKEKIAEVVPDLLAKVGLNPEYAQRFPHQFSGGQRQRIGIARALSVNPQLLVLDEPVSALDVSIQAGVLNLLQQLKAEMGLSYLFVSHDLSVIRHIADRVSVMYLGRTVEAGDVDTVFDNPQHPYTKALLSAVPVPDPKRERERQRILLPGDPPSPTDKQTGCRFRGRCPVFLALGKEQQERCTTETPAMTSHADDHVAACHFPSAKPAAETVVN
ncbi:ABC transporter ATP-binding protein [Streptomyces sp. NBC_00237]|uniref:ABC transporter ATP-binding protein n=1 Tax=Streptomyces sp. NBC_00237 TaxID=2975687 RepID=UPI002254EC7C|nr:ABC transporter ATP-binding protein [Streptomyces sp. NBC_00237]MCX5202588.1 ABC transporter ATP-binding protein [Streptomyces sp. NBC_00237]